MASHSARMSGHTLSGVIRPPSWTCLWLATTRVEQLPVHKSVCSVTKDKKTLAETARTDNVDPSLLAAYKANPYTQPLNTSV